MESQQTERPLLDDTFGLISLALILVITGMSDWFTKYCAFRHIKLKKRLKSVCLYQLY